jgi:hypothetical protein
MSRIKVTGYLNTEDMEPEDLDPDHSSGLSESGYDKVTTYGQVTYQIADLEDIELEVER